MPDNEFDIKLSKNVFFSFEFCNIKFQVKSGKGFLFYIIFANLIKRVIVRHGSSVSFVILTSNL
jgi:hypothetical protein